MLFCVWFNAYFTSAGFCAIFGIIWETIIVDDSFVMLIIKDNPPDMFTICSPVPAFVVLNTNPYNGKM